MHGTMVYRDRARGLATQNLILLTEPLYNNILELLSGSCMCLDVYPNHACHLAISG
jgi:hypothetical protein